MNRWWPLTRILRSPKFGERIDELLAPPGPVALVAPFGSGKREIVADLVRSGKDPDLVVDLRTDPDSVHRVLASPTRSWLIVCCHLEERLLDADAIELRVVDRSDLWFTEADVSDALIAHTGMEAAAGAVAQQIMTVTVGWPLAVSTVIEVLEQASGGSRDAKRILSSGPHIDQLFRLTQRFLGEDLGRYLAIISQFELLSTRVVDSILGPGSSNRLAEAGLPIVEHPDFTLALPPILGCQSQPTVAQLAPKDETDLADSMVELLGMARSIRLLCDLGWPDVAVTMVSDDSRGKRILESPSRAVASIQYLVDRVGPRPALLLELGNAYEATERLDRADEAFREAERLAEQDGDDYQLLRARIALAMLELFTGKTLSPEALDQLTVLQERVGVDRTRVAVGDVEVTNLVQSTDAASISRSVVLGRRNAQEYQSLGMDADAARVLRRLASGSCIHLGRYRIANELLERSQRLNPDLPLAAAQALVSVRIFLAAEARDTALMAQLEPEFRALQRVELLPTAHSSYWLAKLVAASLERDLEQAEAAYRRCFEDFGDLSGAAYEAFVRATALVALVLVGAKSHADEEADRVRELADLDPLHTSIALITYDARLGDPASALDRISSLRSDPAFAPERAWQIEIEELIARGRQGESVDRQSFQKALQAAAQQGMGERADASVPPEYRSDLSPDDQNRIEITLFGGTSVRVRGEQLDLPEGLPLQLIKLLAVLGTAVSVDTVIDSLWPEADLAVGKRRLKNVVSRARGLLEADSIRRAADYLTLGPFVRVDLAGFYDLAARAEGKSPATDQVELISRALDTVAGPLLATDQFVEWAERPRWRSEVVIRDLIDRLLAIPGSRPSAWVLGVVLRAGIEEEDLLISVARFAGLEGSPEIARKALGRARKLALEFGGRFEAPADLEGLDRQPS